MLADVNRPVSSAPDPTSPARRRGVAAAACLLTFVAGAAQMTYTTFVLYNLTGAVAWVSLCLGAGFLFGNIPVVKNNFSLITIGIVFVSVLPMVVEVLRQRGRKPGIG